MSRLLNLYAADPETQPEPHACCALAGKCLRTVSMLGVWRWRLGTPRGVTLQVQFCPWCGERLPENDVAESS